MTNYTETVRMSRASFERVNALLSIEQFGDDPDRDSELQIEEDSETELFSATFENGVSVTLYLCSGQSNYYTSPIFTRKGYEIGSDEADFELSVEECFSFNDDTYTVAIELY